MIRTSLTVMPRRGTLFAAKALVFGAVALVTGLVDLLRLVLRRPGASCPASTSTPRIGQPDVLRAVIGGGAVPGRRAACSRSASGAILRHTAGAISASIGLLFVLFILSELPADSPGRRTSTSGSRSTRAADLGAPAVRDHLFCPGPGSGCSAATRRSPDRGPDPVPPAGRLAGSFWVPAPSGGAGTPPCRVSQPGWQRGHQKMSLSSGAAPWLSLRTGVPQRRHGRPARP